MSRILVKNLPHYVKEDRLREHFSQTGEVTDAKLMRTIDGKSRRFAFIGYRIEEEAEEAVRYFNKSYLDTSRIVCEVARRVGDPDIPRPWSRYSKEKEEELTKKKNQVSDGKIKVDKQNAKKTNDIDDPKLQEFLQVMQPRSKSKLWENDIVTSTPDQTVKGSGAPAQLKEENEKKSKKEFNANKIAQEEAAMHDERPAKSQNVACYDVISDMDYFKSKVKKDFSDSDGDDDHDGSDLNDDDAQANQGAQDGEERAVSEEDLKDHQEGSSVESGDEVTKDANEEFQSGRLFVRNLPYAATEDELAELFSKFGNIAELHLVLDKETKRSKGFAYILYSDPEAAAKALEELDYSIFQGRLLHVLPAKAKHASQNQDHMSEGKAKPFKQKREEERKASEAGGNTRAWNSLFMRADTVVENLARKYGVSKSDFLDREADDLAVRIALGETQIIAETKKALANAGVNAASLEEIASGNSKGVKRSNHVLLVKNLPFSSSEGELSKMFGKFGSLDKIILPPTRTLALVIFLEPAEARAAFRGLAYKRYKDAPLYLEWAPSNILSQDLASNDDSKSDMVVGEHEAKKVQLEQQVEGYLQAEIDPDRVESRSLFVKNLNFKTSDESLRKHISEKMREGKVLSVRIKKHLKNGKNVSMGFGFLEFDSVDTAANVCRDLQGTVLDGHALILQLCHAKKDEKVLSKAENDQSSTKLIVRNVPFEATEKDLKQLFSPFGQVKSLRLPMRFGKHRGFAFVEFVTKQEAQNALKALSSTHLYGRHLVMERAKEGETLEELRARTAAQFANDEDVGPNPMKISKKRKVAALVD